MSDTEAVQPVLSGVYIHTGANYIPWILNLGFRV